MAAKIAANPLQNAKHEAVLQAYFADPERVGYRCYIGVYPNSSEAAAKTGFSRLLKNAEFKARFDFLTAGVAKVVSEKVAISVEQVITELAKIGFANMADYLSVGTDGQPVLDWSDLSRDQAAALAEVTVESLIVTAEGEGDPKPKRGAKGKTGDKTRETADLVRKVKFRLHNKLPALVSIGEHLGAFVKRHADPDGRALGTGAAEVAKLTDLEVARRLAFVLARGEKAVRKK